MVVLLLLPFSIPVYIFNQKKIDDLSIALGAFVTDFVIVTIVTLSITHGVGSAGQGALIIPFSLVGYIVVFIILNTVLRIILTYKDKYKNIGAIVLVVIILIIGIGYGMYRLHESTPLLAAKNEACVSQIIYAVDNKTYQLSEPTLSFSTSDISHFRCASSALDSQGYADGFIQYEISGTDKNGHAFYLYEDAGSPQASSAQHDVLCYKRDGVVVPHSANAPTQDPQTCSWNNDFSETPVSTYEYNK